MAERVLVRASRGEPLERLVCDADGRAFYLANPVFIEAVRAGVSRPVGFPVEDVFAFDARLYAELRRQWVASGATDDSLWREATPYKP